MFLYTSIFLYTSLFNPCTNLMKECCYPLSLSYEKTEAWRLSNLPKATGQVNDGAGIQTQAFWLLGSCSQWLHSCASLSISGYQATPRDSRMVPGSTLVVFINPIWQSGVGRGLMSTELGLPSFRTRCRRRGLGVQKWKGSCNGNFFPFMLWAAHSFHSLDRSSVLFYGPGSWGGRRTERDGELSCLRIATSLLVTWTTGRGCWLMFLYHLGLWLLPGQS